MKYLKLVMILTVLLCTGSLFAQIDLPADGLVGHWLFDDAGNLGLAEIGNDLEPDGLEGVTLTHVPVAGPEAGNGAVTVGLGSFYRCYHDIEANSAFPDSTPTRVNQYTLVIDFHIPFGGVWYAFHAGDNNDDPTDGDWESFIRTSGALGVGSTGYSYYHVNDFDSYYRLVIVCDLGVQYKYYLDGQLLQDGGVRSLDDRFSLDSPDGSNQVLLIGDESGEDAAMDVAEIAIYDRPLTVEEVEGMGGYGHFIPLGSAVGVWTFDNALNLLEASAGSDLELVGEHAATNGPASEDAAVNIGVGSYYKAHHGILANGYSGNGTPTKTNQYSVSFDVKIPALGKFYALFQPDPSNANDPVLFIDEEGKVGSTVLGWSDSTIVKAGEWYRISLSASLGDTLTNAIVVVDMDSVLGVDGLTLDGDLAISPKDAENVVLFFADDNFEDNALDVANINLWNRNMGMDELYNLGGYEHKFSTEETPAEKTVVFKLAENTQYAKAPYSTDFDIPDGRDFTVECWVQIGAGISSDPSFLSNKDWDSGGNNGWNLAAKDDAWDLNLADTTRTRIDFDPPNLNDGLWHHVGFSLSRATDADSIFLFTDNGYTIKLLFADDYIVGNELGDVTNKDNYPLCFGQDGTENYGAKFPGSIDEVRIWHAALSQETLKAWRHKEVTSAHPHYDALVGYWKFNEAEGGIIADASGNGHDAEMVNGHSSKISYAPIGDSQIQNLHDVAAIWGASTVEPTAQEALSGGLRFSSGFSTWLMKAMSKPVNPLLKSQGVTGITSFEDEMYAVVGHNGLSGTTASDLPGTVQARYDRVWYFDATETFNQTIQMDFNLLVDAGVAANYVLLTRSQSSGEFTMAEYTAVVVGEKIMFAFMELPDQTYFTLGTLDETASPLGALTNVDTDRKTPYTYELEANYPNPFNPVTTFSYEIADMSDVKITVYNTLGQKVAQVVDVKKQPAGRYSIQWSADKLVSGIYFYSIEANNFNAIRKMTLLK